MADDEFFVGTGLLDAAIGEHDNTIRTTNGREPMGNDDRRPAFHQVLQSLLNERFRLGIQRRSRLIEYQYRGIFQKRSCDREPLPLATRKPQTALANSGVKAGHELVDQSRLGGAKDCVLTGRWFTVCDVGPYRVIEKDDVLGHDRDLLPQRLQLEVPDIPAVD